MICLFVAVSCICIPGSTPLAQSYINALMQCGQSARTLCKTLLLYDCEAVVRKPLVLRGTVGKRWLQSWRHCSCTPCHNTPRSTAWPAECLTHMHVIATLPYCMMSCQCMSCQSRRQSHSTCLNICQQDRLLPCCK